MEREKGLARGAEGSVSALSKRLEAQVKEVSDKEAAVTELKSRLEEVQVREGGEERSDDRIYLSIYNTRVFLWSPT